MNELKKNIPTHEVKLDNGEVVIFYDYITTGESRELQKLLLEGGKFDAQKGTIDNLPLSTFLESQDKAATFVIKAIKDKDGNEQEFVKEWLDSLPVELGNVVYEEINNITQVSNLTTEEKKS